MSCTPLPPKHPPERRDHVNNMRCMPRATTWLGTVRQQRGNRRTEAWTHDNHQAADTHCLARPLHTTLAAASERHGTTPHHTSALLCLYLSGTAARKASSEAFISVKACCTCTSARACARARSRKQQQQTMCVWRVSV